MTREELAIQVARAERDAAIKRAEEAEHVSDALRLERNARDAEAWKAAGCPPGEVSGYADRAAKAAVDQRDRALALLREQARGEQCEVAEATDDHEQDQGCMDTLDDDGVPRPDVNTACWEHRRRALLAEVDK